MVKRFDRDFKTNERIPFMSARTLLGVTSKEEIERQSYVSLAKKLDSNNKQKLFKRMLFMRYLAIQMTIYAITLYYMINKLNRGVYRQLMILTLNLTNMKDKLTH